MIVRKLRLEKGWSQEQLAEISGLSVRTVQRIERGRNPSLESLKALAAVFEVEITDLKTEAAMPDHATLTSEEEKALIYVRDIKGFYTHLIIYLVVAGALLELNISRGPIISGMSGRRPVGISSSYSTPLRCTGYSTCSAGLGKTP